MQTSIYFYTRNSFREYIKTITDKTKSVPEVLATFRELKVLPKEYKTLVVQQLADDDEKIMDLFTELRSRMEPESPKLSYNKKDREKELIQELVEEYKIDINAAKARVEIGSWPIAVSRDQSTSQIFNYVLEVAIAPVSRYGAPPIKFIGDINSVPGLDGGDSYFQGGTYQWTDKEGYQREATSVRGILSECGFNSVGNAGWKKAPCVLFINLMTPCPKWLGSAGKTHIDLTPYQDLIATTVSDLAYKMPSIRTNPGASYNFTRWSSAAERGEYIKYLKDFLKERRVAVDADPSLRIRDRLTQSGVWYRIRPKLIEDHFVPREDWTATRKGLTSAISNTIEELWPNEGITREYLGIVAKARAVMYFKGGTYLITSDAIDELANVGTTDLIIVEKEGITDVLIEHAMKYSIALVATAGKLVKYAKALIKSAHDNGINVSTLYDDDLSGREAPAVLKEMGLDIPRLGVDKNTVKWLQENGYPELTEEQLLEEYTPETRYQWKYEEYLKTHRIELDSIVAAVGPEALWKYIIHGLEEAYPEPRDYREVIDEPKPEDYYPEEINKFLNYLKEHTEIAYGNKWNEIKENELAKVNGLLQTDYKKVDIDKKLKDTVVNDEGTKTIIEQINEFMESGALPSIDELKAERVDMSIQNK